MVNFRVFWQGTLLSYIGMFHWLRPSTYLASKVLMPLSQILFFTFLGIYATNRANASFYVIGNAIQISAVSGIYGVTMSIGGDRWNGTLPYLFGTPANRFFLFVGRAFMHVIDGMLGVVVGLLWGVVLLNLDLSQTNLPALALTVFITTFSCSGMGLLMGCIGLITTNVMFVNNSVYFLLLIFSGANIPLDRLPAPFQIMAQGLPLTRGIASARALISGASLESVLPLLLGELVIGLLYGLAGFWLFRWFETKAKQKGSLETV
jgi:ABC-2 type transport system permease protein